MRFHRWNLELLEQSYRIRIHLCVWCVYLNFLTFRFFVLWLNHKVDQVHLRLRKAIRSSETFNRGTMESLQSGSYAPDPCTGKLYIHTRMASVRHIRASVGTLFYVRSDSRTHTHTRISWRGEFDFFYSCSLA